MEKIWDEVLPLWVADMDFLSAEPILRPFMNGWTTGSSATPCRWKIYAGRFGTA